MQESFSPDRLYRLAVPAVAVALILLSLWQTAGMFLGASNLIMPNGIAIGSDFLSLWSAAWLAVTGNAVGAYDPETIRAAHNLAVPANTALTLWHYPPSFLLLLAPFGFLPYLPAYILFITLTAVIYLHLLWTLRPHPTTLLLALGFIGFWVNLMAGQNGFLTSCLIGWALVLLQRRPQSAGLLIGILSFKPQLGLSIPLALLAGRHGRTFLMAGLATLLLAAASWLVFGAAPWLAFVENLRNPVTILESGRIPMSHMTSVFSALWITGLPPFLCYLAQAVVAITANIILLVVWRRDNTAFEIKGALLVLAMMLTTPHLFNYDMALLALPLVLMWKHGEQTGWRWGERPILLLVWLAPLLLTPNGEDGKVNLLPLATLGLAFISARRALTKPPSAPQATPAG